VAVDLFAVVDETLRIRSPVDPSRLISSVDEWFQRAPPAGGARHWKDGRSAKELGKAWCRREVIAPPPELHALLDSNSATRDLAIGSGIPEQLTFFADGARGPRHHDFVLYGYVGTTKVVVCIEAKTDEGLDQPIEKRVRTALQKRAREEPTGFPERLDRFAEAMFGFPAFGEFDALDPRLARVPYQLVSGLAGTVREAALRDAERAVFAVHVLKSAELDPVLLEANVLGFQRFCGLLTSGASEIRDGVLIGPLTFPGSDELPRIPLYVGITTTRVGP